MQRQDFDTTTDATPDLLDREFLRNRWHGASDGFFWRQQQRGALVPVSDGTKLRYHWHDVFKFEGGLPPEGMVGAYQADLVTEEQVARRCSVTPSYVRNAAKTGSLPCRRVGRAYLYVPVEVETWRARRFVNRKSLKNSRISPDE